MNTTLATTLVVLGVLIIAGAAYWLLPYQSTVTGPTHSPGTLPSSTTGTSAGTTSPSAGQTSPGSGSTSGGMSSSIKTVYTMRVGQTLNADGFTATVLEVTEDSRCPMGVQCVSAGTVKVRVRASYGAQSATQTLELGVPFTAFDYMVTLASVEPTKTQGTIPQGGYVLHFEVVGP